MFLVGTELGWGGATTAEWAQRPRMLDPPGRIFESLPWEVEAGDPVDAGTFVTAGHGELNYLWMLFAAMSAQIISKERLRMLSSRTSFPLSSSQMPFLPISPL